MADYDVAVVVEGGEDLLCGRNLRAVGLNMSGERGNMSCRGRRRHGGCTVFKRSDRKRSRSTIDVPVIEA